MWARFRDEPVVRTFEGKARVFYGYRGYLGGLGHTWVWTCGHPRCHFKNGGYGFGFEPSWESALAGCLQHLAFAHNRELEVPC